MQVELTADSLLEYAELVTRWWFEDGKMERSSSDIIAGVRRQIQAFSDGINEVFPVSSLKVGSWCLISFATQAFSAEELQRMFCGDLHIKWASGVNANNVNPETMKKLEYGIARPSDHVDRMSALLKYLTVMRPYSKESPVFRMLVEELSEMNNDERGDFLEFTTAKRC